MKKFIFVLIVSINSIFASTWTAEKEVKFDFSKTDINVDEVKVEFHSWCWYDKKYIDIIEGRVGRRTVSCGENKKLLSIKNNALTLPAVEKYNHLKGGDLKNYTMSFKMLYRNKTLFWFTAYSENMIKFYKADYNITFKEFELKSTELLFDGVNVINSPLFSGTNTEVGLFFYSPFINNVSDTHFRLYFKAYGSFEFLQKNGKAIEGGIIKLDKAYFPIINGQEDELTVSASARLKDGTGFKTFKTNIPLDQNELDNLSKIELK